MRYAQRVEKAGQSFRAYCSVLDKAASADHQRTPPSAANAAPPPNWRPPAHRKPVRSPGFDDDFHQPLGQVFGSVGKPRFLGQRRVASEDEGRLTFASRHQSFRARRALQASSYRYRSRYSLGLERSARSWHLRPESTLTSEHCNAGRYLIHMGDFQRAVFLEFLDGGAW